MAKFYSVGVGAGDGSYITLGALRALEQADIIAVPVKKYGEKSTALEIIRKEFDTDKKEISELEFRMSGDTKVREESQKFIRKNYIGIKRRKRCCNDYSR